MTDLRPTTSAEPQNQIIHDLEGVPLDRLFAEAMGYGEITLFQRENRFSFKIKFQTIAGCTLEAHSGFGHATIASAIIATIGQARKIQKQLR